MAFFFNANIIRPLREVDVNGQPQDTDADQTTDYSADDTDTNNEPINDRQDNNPEEQNQDNRAQDNNSNQDEVQDPETTDYTEEDAASGDQDEEIPSDNGGNNTGGGNPPPPEEQQPVDDFKKQEEELYGDLTPEQLDIKHKELKNQFLNLYDLTTNLSERINDAVVSEDNIEVVEYISNQLAELRKMIVDYMNGVYKTKSYIENSINYNRFLAIISALNKILEEMAKKED